MKKRIFLFGAIFAFLGVSVQAQIHQMHYQGFESGEPVNYAVVPSTAYSRTMSVSRGGDYSLHVHQLKDNEVEFYLDTLDFTQTQELRDIRYISLYFDHICKLPKNTTSGAGLMMGAIYYKLAYQSTWTQLTSQHYATPAGERSTEFGGNGGFNNKSYSGSGWDDTASGPTNAQWRSERFNIDNALTASVAANERKVIIKFVVKRRSLSGPADTNRYGWWIDNIKVDASADRMLAPTLKMVAYPDGEVLASSRGARIEFSAKTSLSAGMNRDSVYVVYRVGSDPTEHRVATTSYTWESPVTLPTDLATRTVYSARIPFAGYDTMMYFYCVARDSTSNSNMSRFPSSSGTWARYYCTRGTAQAAEWTSGMEGSVSVYGKSYPFPGGADSRSEWVYDSATMRNAGYGPGAMTSMKFMIGESMTAPQTRQKFQFRLKNVPTDYKMDPSEYYRAFTGSYMQIVYDSALTIPQLSANTEFNVNLKDTFYYAGKGLMVQAVYDDTYDPAAVSVKTRTIPAVDSLKTIYYSVVNASYHGNGYEYENSNLAYAYRPAMVFYQSANLPLLYDAGFDTVTTSATYGLVTPNYNVPMTPEDHSVQVRLKNCGALPFDAIRISFTIMGANDTVSDFYDWSGNLAAGATEAVTIAPNVPLAPGFYTLKVWVEDTLTANSHSYRDHEPYNDTIKTEFIVCAGPMNGVRNIGGANKHFSTIEEFLFSLSRCGIDDSLIVRLAPGSYPAFTMPMVNGLTEAHYIVFESQSDTMATLYYDEMQTQGSIVNLENVAHVRFRNMEFVRRNGALEQMVQMGQNSDGCRFEGCRFIDSLANPEALMRIGSMINSGYSDGMQVLGCTFEGGLVGVKALGSSSESLSMGVAICGNRFSNQYNNAVQAVYQTNLTIDGNEMYDVLTNGGFVAQVNDCYGSISLQRNRIFTSNGAGAMGLSGLTGTATAHALVANNMMVCEDNGNANSQWTPFNIISGSYIEVVYNSVKMNAPTRNNVAATTFGGSGISNCTFVDNIVAAMDNRNYALSYQPGNNTSNTLSNNVYYSNGSVLNRRVTTSCLTIETWKMAEPADSLSISVNPGFLNGSLVDLRTYNRAVKGVGIPVASVTTDIFDTLRGIMVTCPGAFEFSSLAYDFEVEALLNPPSEDCYMPDSVEMVLLMRNNGMSVYNPATSLPLGLSYQMNGGAVHNLTVTQTVPAEDSVSIHTGVMLHLPANGHYDSVYSICVWTSFGNDPNQTNDTNVFRVVSHSHPSTPADDTVQVNYNTAISITPTEGVEKWDVYNSTTAPQRYSQLFWYSDSIGGEPFYVGNSYTTDSMRENAEYYIMQRRSLPIVRITQVEISTAAAAQGTTPNSGWDTWRVSNRKGAVQLTNIGDATAYLQGDTLQTVSSTSSLNTVFVMPDVKIEPGQSLVVQYGSVSGNPASDSSKTIRTQTSPSFNYNSNVGFIYRRGGVIEDALAFNSVITNGTSWTSKNVPSYVWSGSSISVPATRAGVVRTAFNGNSTDWTLSTADNPMFLDHNNPAWIRYSDNGCEGGRGKITVEVINVPTVDISLSALVLPEGGCALGDEEVSVMVHNFGVQATDTIVLNFRGAGDTVSEVIANGIGARDSMVYTFTNRLHLDLDADTLVTVHVWVNSIQQDVTSADDTVWGTVDVKYTPDAPAAIPDRQITYATRDTITYIPTHSGVVPVWYNYNMNAVDTGFTHVTDILYAGGTMGMSLLVDKGQDAIVGTGTNTSAKTSLPSPYQPNNAYVRQQYMYSAHDLATAGLTAGGIYSISFFLDSIYNINTTTPRDSVVFDNYFIAMGLASDTIFGSTSSWKTVSQVYERHPMVIYRRQAKDWVRLDLDTPFQWDGTSSLVVQVAYQLSTTVTTGTSIRYTSKANSTLYKAQNTAMSPSIFGYSGTGSRSGNRPNIRFNKIIGCGSPVTPFNMHLVGVPQMDMAMIGFADSLVYNSCSSVTIPVQVRNQGEDTATEIKFYYYLDNQPVDSTMHAVSIVGGQFDTLTLFNKSIEPGRHSLTAVLSIAGDSIASNDTLRTTFVVRYCGGVYTIAADSTGDYTTFSQAVDTLSAVGIVGPVTFQVANGVYDEQVTVSNVFGSSQINSISFVGMGDSVILTYAPTVDNNYVLKFNAVSNINLSNMTLVSRPTTTSGKNYGNVLLLQDVHGMHLTESNLKVSRNIVAGDKNVNNFLSNVCLMGDVSGLHINNCTIDSGFYAVKCEGATGNYDHIYIGHNTLANFAYGAVLLRDVSDLFIRSNDIRSSNSSSSRGLTGLYLSQVTDSFIIEKNMIYLISDNQGAKRGMQLENVGCDINNPGYVVNNMISTYGTGSAGLDNVKVGNANKAASAGIIIDSTSSYVNILFNTVRVYGTTSTAASVNDLTLAFLCGLAPTNLQVMNNIFSNFSNGYAYYITSSTGVTTSNFNAYYSEANNKFGWGATALAQLTALQAANSDDGNSVFDEPFFEAIDDLHLLKTNFAEKAQYNTEVVDDIDGNSRPQIPAPTIGAHEAPRLTHDMSVVRIHAPVVPANPLNIETDSLKVVVSFYNNGRSNETDVSWYAYIEGYEDSTRSVTRNLSPFAAGVTKKDSVMLHTILGLIDTQVVHVVLLCPTDTALANNEMTAKVYLAPAFNLKASNVTVTPNGCNMQNAEVKITLQNVGYKPFPAGTQIKIGYHTEIKSPANVVIPTLPDTVEQYITLQNTLPTGNSSVTLTFDSLANLYPTDTAINIDVYVKGWCHYQYDIIPLAPGADTTAFITKNSYFTPAAPVGYDTVLPYGTWGAVRASQENGLPIRWYNDTTSASFFFPGSNQVSITTANYNRSTLWNNTPQFFDDTVYYLRCYSNKNCPSEFSSVNVTMAPRIPNDIAFKEVLAPLGNRVYMENDTVRVKISNFGTAPQSNIPITYVLKQGNNVLQTVTETIHDMVPAGQDYVYTFDSLLNTPYPTTAKTYTLQVWTALPNDGVRRNDTIRQNYTFSSLAVTKYNTFQPPIPTEDDTRWDITRISWNGIDMDLTPLNRSYTNLAAYPSPEYPTLHVTRGTTDTIIIQVTPLDGEAQHDRCKAWVSIDFDRSGIFNDNASCNERPVNAMPFYDDSTFKAEVTIPECASLGYQRMRVNVTSYSGEQSLGHAMDFLLFVDEKAPAKDLAIAGIYSPRSYLIHDDTPREVSFRMYNRGTQAVSAADIHYSFAGDSLNTGVLHWTGNLLHGTSTVVTLPIHSFCLGTTTLTIWHELEGDVDSTNNILVYEYHRFHTVNARYLDNFDSLDLWYAPTGYNAYTRNYWELGAPNKTRLDTAWSGTQVWATDLNSNISSGTRGNISYLYSPIIDNSMIHIDTISFRMRRNFTNGSTMHIEYLNFEGRWVKMAPDSVLTWYNNTEDMVFNGTSTNSGDHYTRYWFSSSATQLSGNYPEKMQIRFVYRSPADNKSSYGEGCAIDDFYLGRARRNYDAGVVAITKPEAPKFGQTLYPEVVVKNYGFDTIREFDLGYTHYGSILSKISHFSGVRIPPDGTDTFLFDAPFIVTSDYPDSFYISAYASVLGDIYHDNDTCQQLFYLYMLDNDIAADSIMAPLNYVIAGDTGVTVTLRIHNFGLNPIHTATASYFVNGVNRVDEFIDFDNSLNHRPLASDEYINYTFRHKIHAAMGLMNLTVFVKTDSNDYLYNDTVFRRIEGITSVSDLEAASVIVDTSSFNNVRIGLVIENRGARGANNFEVGYWIDNDTSTMVRETYYRALPLPALTTGYYIFDADLPTRAAPYDHVNAFVHIDNDNNPNNDTTDLIAEQYTDIEVTKVIVEENAGNECRVFLELRNIGNLALVDKQLRLRATVNGNDLSYNVRQRVNPGQAIHFQFEQTIPKSPTRQYEGTGRVLDIAGDDNSANNQTSIVEVVNYMEGIPFVDAGQLVLEQNYPNPFTKQTTIPFILPNAAHVHFFVMDAMGHIVYRDHRFYQAGNHSLNIDMEAYPAGFYYYGIEVDGQRQMRKMILK